MKGWLDNFGKADNANESNVSLPEGFVGVGYDTKGRNYSPAWGGQFEQGGIIPIAQNGVSEYMEKKKWEEKDKNIAKTYDLPEVVVSAPEMTKYNDPDKLTGYPQYIPKSGDNTDIPGWDMAEFYKSWVSSPEYERRMKNTGYYEDVPGNAIYRKEGSTIYPQMAEWLSSARESRMGALESVQEPGFIQIEPSYYKGRPASRYTGLGIEIHPDHTKTPEMFETVLAHEIGHAIDSTTAFEDSLITSTMLPFSEFNKSFYTIDPVTGNYQPINQKDDIRRSQALHIRNDPQEFKSDLNALRYLMFDKGVYDIRKGKEFTKEDLERAKEKLKGNQSLDRTIQAAGESGLIKLMNVIAKKDEEVAPIAMNGASMPGSVGFTYARVAGAAPSKGKYAKKTMASAQNGTILGPMLSPILMAGKILSYLYPNEEASAAPTVAAPPVEYKKGLTDELLKRQAYKESTFNPAAVSPAGYKGLTQIGDSVLKDYSKKKGGQKLDPFNPKDAVELQKFAMDDLYNASFINKADQPDSVRIAKTLAAYNWGRGNLFNYLNEQKQKGVDIYGSYDWLNDLPKETSDYVNKILLQQDQSFNKNYNKASTNPKYKDITSLYGNKKFGGNIPSAQNGEEDIKTIDLPEITITPDDSEQYPFYQSLSNEQKKYINDNTAIGRATRALAITGKRGQTASDISKVVKDVEKFGFEATGVPGTSRFAGDPLGKLTSTGKTLLDLGLMAPGYANPLAPITGPALYSLLGGTNPITGEQMFNQQNLQGAFDTLDALGMIGGAAGLLKQPVQKGFQLGAKTAGKLLKLEDPIEAVSKISSKSELPTSTSVANVVQEPTARSVQEIPGLHLKSTMSGSPLEKQLSKTGTINVNNIKSHIGKAETGNQDKFIIQKVLDEKFPEQTQINYDDFRKAVSEELVPLQRNTVLDYKHTNYGVGKLGYPAEQKSFYEDVINRTKGKIEEAKEQLKGKIEPTSWSSASQARANLKLYLRELEEKLAREIKKYEDVPLEQVSITYNNPSQFGKGHGGHFDDTTLGHARTLVSKDEPDVMHILEQQSDYWQHLEKGKPIDLQKEAERLSRLETDYLNDLEILENIKKNRVDVEGNPMDDFQIAQFEEIVNKKGSDLNLRKGDLANPQQKEFLGKAHLERLMQENVKYAAEQGKSKVRFPTSETSASIQGYIPKNLRRELNNRVEELAEVKKEIGFKDIADDDILPMELYGYRSLSETPVTKSEYLKLLNNRIKELKSLPDKELDANIFKPEHQTILKKYAEQPKMIKKLFGVEPKIVKDAKGNSWYEFDIPKSFKEGKAEIKAFKNGGKVTTAQNGQEMKFYQNGLDWKPKSMQRGGNDFDDHIFNPLAKKLANLSRSASQMTNDALQKVTDLQKMTAYTSFPTYAAKAHGKFNRWLFNNIRPVQYPTLSSGIKNISMGLLNQNAPPQKDNKGLYNVGEEAWQKALSQQPIQSHYIIPSKHKPSDAKDPNAKYYTLREGIIDPQLLIEEVKRRNLKDNEVAYMPSLTPFIRKGFMSEDEFSNIDPLQKFKLMKGSDDKGNFVSIYDKYDFEGPLNSLIVPYEFYDRFYLPKKKDGGGIVKDNQGYWNPENWGKPVEIDSNDITMEGVYEPLLGISDTGDTKLMKPGKNYKFKGKKVTEFPVSQNGSKLSKQEVDDVKNFIINYHKSPMFKQRVMSYDTDNIKKFDDIKKLDESVGYLFRESEKNPDQQKYLNKALLENLAKSSVMKSNLDDTYEKYYSPQLGPISSAKVYQSNEQDGYSSYNPVGNEINLNLGNTDVEGLNPSNLEKLAHEYSHAVSTFNKSKIAPAKIRKEVRGYMKNINDSHDADFMETKADIDAIRYLLNKENIYDASREEFTKEHLDRANDKLKDSALFKRLKRIYGNDDSKLIYLMNTIASNKEEQIPVAKLGINQLDAQPMKKLNQLLNFTNNPDKDNWLDKYN